AFETEPGPVVLGVDLLGSGPDAEPLRRLPGAADPEAVPVEEVGPRDGVVGVLRDVVDAEGEAGLLEEDAAVDRADPAVVAAALPAGNDDLGGVVRDEDVRLVLAVAEAHRERTEDLQAR